MKFGAQLVHRHVTRGAAVPRRQRRRHPRRLPGRKAGHDQAHRVARDRVGRDAAPGDQQPVHLGRHQAAIGHVVAQALDLVVGTPVWKVDPQAGDAVLELPAGDQVFVAQAIEALDPPAEAHAQLGPGQRDARVLIAGQALLEVGCAQELFVPDWGPVDPVADLHAGGGSERQSGGDVPCVAAGEHDRDRVLGAFG